MLKQISTLDWQKQQQSSNDLTTCGDPAHLTLRLNWTSIPSFVVSTAIYASETWKSTARICQQLDVFHQHNLRKILGITWKDHVSIMEVLSRTGQQRLQDINSRKTTSDGRPYHQDATWMTSQSRHVMDPSW